MGGRRKSDFKKNTFENNEDITITNFELRFAADDINKSDSIPKGYQRQIPENLKRDVGKYAFIWNFFRCLKIFIETSQI